MKLFKIFSLISFLLLIFIDAQAADKDRFCKVASYTFMGLIEDIAATDKKYNFGELICKAGGGSGCYSSSVGEGICKAGGGSGCYSSSVGEGICKAGGGSGCYSSSVGEGICKGAGVYCNNPTLEEALCKAADVSNCSDASFSKMLAFSIKVCGVGIFYNYKPQE